ncbi:MAG: isoprenylcysteine carboxylmethyltransferase family protein [Alphaproteobacteria bacterium]|nr:isoprenylcysteine carboxylmethyltransferase family protein [Alphaproteobacteria bacterium]
MAEEDHAHVIAPPPLIYLAFLLAGMGIDALVDLPGLGLSVGLRLGLGLGLFGVGLTLVLAAAGNFRRSGEKPAPWTPTNAIVDSGPYRFTRNPMYLGMALAYLGLAIGADSLVALALLFPVLLIIQFGVIAREERYLEGKFGAPYRAFKARVRRWL